MIPSFKTSFPVVTLLVFSIGCTQTAPPTGQGNETVTSENTGKTSEERTAENTGKPQEERTVVKSNAVKQSQNKALRRELNLARSARKAQDTDHYSAAPGRRIVPGGTAGIRLPSEPPDRETYAHFDDNPVKRVLEHPVSTFSIDVDTGSYANVRRMLNAGRLPRQDAVRTEELINYFDYDYPLPSDPSTPFAVHREIAPAPWRADTYLLQIGIRGYEVPQEEIPPANLVFLVDVSGSMNSPDKLGLLKSSLRLLTRRLDEQDRVAIVVYAGASGVVLEPTRGNEKGKIHAALEQLRAGGSTNGAAGIRLAYAMAEQAFINDGINRVLLATDGDFNVGTVNIEQLKDLVEDKRRSGIALTTLGFGTGNYNDHLMEQIADTGNGNYAYIDSLSEAHKVLVDELGSTLLTIARDVKIQIEFNPARVAEYRLIGYENRSLRREDFNNDNVDAGDIGAGHSVTALYEIILNDSKARRMDAPRYGNRFDDTDTRFRDELAFLRMRYKQPGTDHSRLQEWAINQDEIRKELASASDDFRFAAAVAAYGQILRGAAYTGDMSFDDVAGLASHARGNDPSGYRSGFLSLVNMAASLQTPGRQSGPVARH